MIDQTSALQPPGGNQVYGLPPVTNYGTGRYGRSRGSSLLVLFGHVFVSSALFLDSICTGILIPVEFDMADKTVLVVLLSIAYI